MNAAWMQGWLDAFYGNGYESRSFPGFEEEYDLGYECGSEAHDE